MTSLLLHLIFVYLFSSLYSVNILLDGFETLWLEVRLCYGKHSIDALSNLKKKSDKIFNIESLNHLGFNPALPSQPLNHVPKCHVYMSFKYFQ